LAEVFARRGRSSTPNFRQTVAKTFGSGGDLAAAWPQFYLRINSALPKPFGNLEKEPP
jgi:hypothetical protein